MTRSSLLASALAVLAISSSPRATGLVQPAEHRPITTWSGGAGVWSEAARWSAGVPSVARTAWVGGRSEVVVPAGTRAVAAGLEVGHHGVDRARLTIDGGTLVVRQQFVRIGEEGGAEAEVLLEAGALHAASFVYLGGASRTATTGAAARLIVRGGSLVARLLWVGFGPGSQSLFEIDGSAATAVHFLDYLRLFGPPERPNVPPRSTLSFVLDRHGVTPITIQSRNQGGGLRIALKDSPPHDDVTLVASAVPTVGAFHGLPEGSRIAADHNGRRYTWTLTYRGGRSGHDLVLKNARGTRAGDPVSRARAALTPPAPLWLDVPPVDYALQGGALAFPEAEGFGARTPGGRNGRVLVVNTLADAGPGSLREAVGTRGPRTIRFDVGGEIQLATPLVVEEPFVSILGASAPAPGIVITRHGLSVRTHDVVLRHLRIRPGDDAGADTEGEDALSFVDARRCIADHLSVSWGTDEVLSITGLSDEITIQWSIISEALNPSGHGFASISGGHRVTWHHNLFAHHVSRVPRFQQVAYADFRNNVLYNWGHTAGYGEFERLNYVGNVLKPGPSTTQRPPMFHTGDSVVPSGSLYLEGNVIDGDRLVTNDNRLGIGYGADVYAPGPFPFPSVRTDAPAVALERVLQEAGATMPARDGVDARVVESVRNGTGRIIRSTREGGR